jgi:hypothetical protein
MKYALLIYSTPGVSDRPAAELTQAWVDYTGRPGSLAC